MRSTTALINAAHDVRDAYGGARSAPSLFASDTTRHSTDSSCTMPWAGSVVLADANTTSQRERAALLGAHAAPLRFRGRWQTQRRQCTTARRHVALRSQ